MGFDARAAELPAPGEHYTVPDCPGLRFEVSSTVRAWIFRFWSWQHGILVRNRLARAATRA
jgi:hypothetical protein